MVSVIFIRDSVGILSVVSDGRFDALVDVLIKKNFTAIRQWVKDNLDTDPATVYRQLYDNIVSKLDPNSIPSAILILGEYQYKSAFVADQEINLICCLIEIINECEFV